MKKILFVLSLLICLNSYASRNDSLVLKKLDSISVMLDTLCVDEPLYVMAQAAYESGWFACKNCSWQYNNMFGFKGANGKYLRFKKWQDCVFYYAAWQKKRYPLYKERNPEGTYLEFLRWSHYNTGNEYAKSIQWMCDWLINHWHK